MFGIALESLQPVVRVGFVIFLVAISAIYDEQVTQKSLQIIVLYIRSLVFGCPCLLVINLVVQGNLQLGSNLAVGCEHVRYQRAFVGAPCGDWEPVLECFCIKYLSFMLVRSLPNILLEIHESC